MKELLYVSIVIPCRNEEKFIGRCLDSIIANDFPKNRLEVLVVDGISEDETREIVGGYASQYKFIRHLDNPNKITPAAMNIGIKNAKGEIIIIMGAHSEYSSQYINMCIKHLHRTCADVVGGPINTRPGATTFIARCIALATSHPFGVGNSRFRTSAREGYVDTVPFGAYRRDVFNKVGLFDERLVRNQDNELSSRVIKNGGKIYFSPELRAYYYNQTNIYGLLKQALITGMWNVVTLKINSTAFRWRHVIPFFFVTAIIVLGFLAQLHPWTHFAFLALLGLYFCVAWGSSFQIAIKEGIQYIWILPVVFFLYHVCYGIGTWAGLLKMVISGRESTSGLKQHKPKNKGGNL